MKNLLILLVSFSLIGCASKATKSEISTEKEKVGYVESRETMIERTRSILANSDNLTLEQRSKFLDLHNEILAEVDGINQEIRKSKIVLFKAMTNKNYDRKKVGYLSRSLKKLHDKKFDVMMDGLEKGRDILGIAAPEILHKAWDVHGSDAFY